MQLDTVYEPVVLGSRLFLGSSWDDSVRAYDTRTGAELWCFLAEGPVRYAPVAWENRVAFVSDDGYLYCLDSANGTLLWKVRGGPSDRKILGNERLISTWPARGAPVLADNTLYFAAGIWPFMGIFLHAVDARTGKILWTNDGDGSLFIKQPHNAEAFAGVAPQGPLVVAGDRLLVPGGRSVPACYDRRTGQLLYYLLAENGKRGGGSLVCAAGELVFNGGDLFHLATGKYLAPSGERVVFGDEVLHVARNHDCRAYDLKASAIELIEKADRKGVKSITAQWKVRETGSADIPGNTTLIRAGNRLFVGGDGKVQAFHLPLTREPAEPSWQAEVDGEVGTLIAADERLFAVTRVGTIYCFGAREMLVRKHPLASIRPAEADRWTDRASALLKKTGVREGYAVVWGVGSGRLIEELVQQSTLRLVVIEPDTRRAHAFRTRLSGLNLAAERVTVVSAGPLEASLPPYLASQMVMEDRPAEGWRKPLLAKMFHALRPYGGVACLPVKAEERAAFARTLLECGLEGARVRTEGEHLLLSREGALPGSANWTHEHADASNTRVSRDRIVKAPLGLLWFGGSSNEGILPRHGHGPQPQVVDGRLIIEGVDLLRAQDIYTGRVLWQVSLPGLGVLYNNLSHQPGANAAGSNLVSLSDGIYVVHGKHCLRLDPATGARLNTFSLPGNEGPNPSLWGYLNVHDRYLIGGGDPLFDPKKAKELLEKQKDNGDDKDPADTKTGAVEKLLSKKSALENDNFSSSKKLVAMDRHTGKVLWSVEARCGFRHNAICIGGGRIYCIDRLSGLQLSRLKRRGEEPPFKPRLVAYELRSGKEVWSTEHEVFGTWLSYSQERDLLVESGRVARDTLTDEPKGMRTYRGSNGAVLWFESKHAGPAMIHGDTILMAGSACDLLTGKIRTRQDPLSGEEVNWTWTRGYGCNTPAASEHLLTFRSGAAGFFDLCNDGGTANLGGFRSSCTNNLIVAGGVLTAPDYTRTCTCNYQNQTSVGLIHMPEAELWTYFGTSDRKRPIRHLGINLGAPGDRKDERGTLWLEFPSTGGSSPRVTIKTTPDKPTVVRHHQTQVQAGERSWVASSAATGLTTLTVALADRNAAPRTYTIRLHFAELEEVARGERIFSVMVQGKTVLDRIDVVKEAGGRNRGLVREFKGVTVSDELTVKLTPCADARLKKSILSGIEILAEGW